jgi:DNA-binding MarR family transcriptional regulator
MALPRLFHLLHTSHRAVFREADKMLLDQFGVSAAQHAVLMFLVNKPGSLVGELASAVGLSSAAASGLISRMADGGLLERRQSPNDKRASELYASEKGQAIVAGGAALVKQGNERLAEGFSEEDLAVVERFLSTVAKRAADGMDFKEARGS